MSDRDARHLPTVSGPAVSRRTFLEQAGRVAAGAVALGAGGFDLLAPRQASAAAQRLFSAARFALVLDGAPTVFLQSFQGGSARAEVIPQVSPGGFGVPIKKGVGLPVFDPIVIRTALGAASKPLLDHAQALLGGAAPRVHGAIAVADSEMKVQQRLLFTNALVTEVVFPALDVSSKEAAFMDVTLRPEQTRWEKAKGEPLAPDAKAAIARKTLLSSFDLTIDGVDCTGVQRIEPLTIRTTTAEGVVGSRREFVKEPGKLELPNLVVLVPEPRAQGFLDWHKSFVIDGKNADEQEKTAVIRLLDAARKEELLSFSFEHLGIFAAAPVGSATQAPPLLKAEMYCESMRLSPFKA
jgi:hypothetical protein